jgi:hypothetical protein
LIRQAKNLSYGEELRRQMDEQKKAKETRVDRALTKAFADTDPADNKRRGRDAGPAAPQAAQQVTQQAAQRSGRVTEATGTDDEYFYDGNDDDSDRRGGAGRRAGRRPEYGAPAMYAPPYLPPTMAAIAVDPYGAWPAPPMWGGPPPAAAGYAYPYVAPGFAGGSGGGGGGYPLSPLSPPQQQQQQQQQQQADYYQRAPDGGLLGPARNQQPQQQQPQQHATKMEFGGASGPGVNPHAAQSKKSFATLHVCVCVCS